MNFRDCGLDSKSLCRTMLVHSKDHEWFSRKNRNRVIKLLSLLTTLPPFNPGFEIVLVYRNGDIAVCDQEGSWAVGSPRLWWRWHSQTTHSRASLITGAMLAIFWRLSLLTAGLASLTQFLKRTKNSSGNGSLKKLFRIWKKTVGTFISRVKANSRFLRQW